MLIRNNVITDDRATQSQDNRFFWVHTYGPDALYTDVISGGKLQINNNCYYNASSAPTFGLFESNNADTSCSGRGNSGTSYSFSSWQSAGYDTTSYSENPVFSTSNKATSSNCLNKGWQNGLPVPGGSTAPSVKNGFRRKL